MRRKVNLILSYVLVAVVAVGVTLVCTLLAVRDNSRLKELERVIDRFYIGDVDKKAREDALARAMVAALGDKWSYYMTAEEYLEYQEAMSNSYVGVGITVQNSADKQGIEIVAVTAGGPAEAAGIQPEDRIVAIDGTSVVEMDVNSIAGLIKGEEGTFVEIGVQRAGESLNFRVVRQRFRTPVATLKMLDDGIALITIENFDNRCAQETIAAIEQARSQGAKALLFDVRNNPGGYKDEMVKVLDYLLPEGALFRSRDYKGNSAVDYSDASCVDMPMAVIMNLNSYSAAEFFAAALQEYDAAITVGEQTFGKGRFQSVIELSGGAAVNLSIGEYYTPSGKNLAGVGLAPEIEVIVDEETAALIAYDRLEAADDPQIQAAVNVLKQGF